MNSIVRMGYVHPWKPEQRHIPKESDEVKEPELRAGGWRPWWEVWDHEYTVVYGHSTTDAPRVHQSEAGGLTIGLDTGCVYGGFLTAVVLPDFTFVSVKARARYAERKR